MVHFCNAFISATSFHSRPSPFLRISITCSIFPFPSPFLLPWRCGAALPSSGGYSTRPSRSFVLSFSTHSLSAWEKNKLAVMGT